VDFVEGKAGEGEELKAFDFGFVHEMPFDVG